MACDLARSVEHQIEATPTDVAASPTMAWRVSPRDLEAMSDALPLFPKVRRGALAGSEAAGHWPMAGYRPVAERRLDVLAEEASAGGRYRLDRGRLRAGAFGISGFLGSRGGRAIPELWDRGPFANCSAIVSPVTVKR
jgi:hypothetical protein